MWLENLYMSCLMVFTIAYLLVILVFEGLEFDTEIWVRKQEIETAIIQKLRITSEEYREMEAAIIEIQSYSTGTQETYFFDEVMAMIGIRNLAPVYVKVFWTVYVLIGILLGLTMFQSIDEYVREFASMAIRLAKQCLRFCRANATGTDLMFVARLSLAMIITAAGAALFYFRYEKWSYMDNFYYYFVTLTTIGFGDYVAPQNDRDLITTPGYTAFSLVFILFWLAVVVVSFNLLVLRFMTTGAEQLVIAVDGGETVTSANDKLLTDHNTVRRDADDEDQADQASVGSCACVEPAQHDDYNQDDDMTTITPLLEDNLTLLAGPDPQSVAAVAEQPTFKRVSV